MACALWYWSHFSIYCEIYDTEEAAASTAASMEDAESAAIAGVQHEDGSFVPRDRWAAIKAEHDRRDEQWRARQAAEALKPQPATREVVPPFDARGQTATIPADMPSWVGDQTT